MYKFEESYIEVKKKLEERFECLSSCKSRNQIIVKISNSLYKELPKGDIEFLNICDKLIRQKEYYIISVVTYWVKKRMTVYELKYIDIYERWLMEIVHDWGTCDVLCYRVLNPMIEKFPQLESKIFQWAENDNPYIRRAAIVALLHSSQTFSVNVSFEIVNEILVKLLLDDNVYIQNAIGWLLKYSYLSYPMETMDFIKNNIQLMSKKMLRYAKEKMSYEDKKEIDMYA